MCILAFGFSNSLVLSFLSNPVTSNFSPHSRLCQKGLLWVRASPVVPSVFKSENLSWNPKMLADFHTLVLPYFKCLSIMTKKKILRVVWSYYSTICKHCKNPRTHMGNLVCVWSIDTTWSAWKFNKPFWNSRALFPIELESFLNPPNAKWRSGT